MWIGGESLSPPPRSVGCACVLAAWASQGAASIGLLDGAMWWVRCSAMGKREVRGGEVRCVVCREGCEEGGGW